MVSICSTVEHSIAICDKPISWSATGDFWSGAGTLAGAFAVIYAARKGASTVRQWKKQKLAERHIEQAERILTAVANAKDALAQLRSPAMWSHELDAARAKLANGDRWNDANADGKRRLENAQAYFDRLARANEPSVALNSCRPMARAFFGDEVANAIETLNHQFWIVETYIDASVSDRGENADFSNRIRQALYANGLEVGNEVSDRVRTSLATIEGQLLPILRQEADNQDGGNLFVKWIGKLRGQEKSEG